MTGEHMPFPSFFRRSAIVLLVFLAFGCDKLLTTSTDDTTASPMDNPPSIMAAFARGDEQFARIFRVSEGLGPVFNQPSCETCHPGDGRGTPQTILKRFSINGDLVPKLGGPQLQDRAIPGVPPETIPAGAEVSVRMPPPVFGRGLMEMIPAATIIALEDPDDLDGDGISGRVNWVQPADFVPSIMMGAGPGLAVGRFGLKANVSSLLHQIVAAYHDDMGITTDFQPEESLHPLVGDLSLSDVAPDPELPGTEVLDVLMYIRTLAVPPRGELTDQVQRGDAMFEQIGCASCHVPNLKTGPSAIPSLNMVDAPLYSDMLLHDLGEELADHRADGSANGFEWRTVPLMGLRLAADNLGGTVHYLHDGRTSDLSEAILIHGGEAQASRDRFNALSAEESEAVLAFLLSL
jgi:CxxC motif-containing protein (DUF1111 family)